MSTPEAQGIRSDSLVRVFGYVRDRFLPIHSLLIVRHGSVILDAYFFPYDGVGPHDLASVTKSVTATLIGLAIQRGRLPSVRAQVLPLFPGRTFANPSARKDAMTLDDLLSMQSGLDCRYDGGEPTLREMRQTGDWVGFMLGRPMAAQPGTRFVYCSGGMHVLSAVLTQATGMTARAFARGALLDSMGIGRVEWPSDTQGVSFGWGDLHLHPHDMAKIGYLYLQHGRWSGRQLLDSAWVAAATSPHTHRGGAEYGYGWWVSAGARGAQFEAVGRGGQRITVVPSLDAIIVYTGGGFDPGPIGELLSRAVAADTALPDDSAAGARLHAALVAATQPPPTHPVPSSPALASRISGRLYVFDDNPFGVRTFGLVFPATGDPAVRISFSDGRSEERAIGLDGVPRVSPNGRFGLPVAVAGFWGADDTFVLNYDEVANINWVQLRVRFRSDQVDVTTSDRSGTVLARFHGKPERP